MQRVTIGRALVRRPSAMLMDEPIGALDAKLREQMRTELRRLHVDNDSTTVYVTHDQVEAMAMADKIGIMNDGVLQQYDNPDTVYDEPANLFVAQFVGSPIMNIADCRCELADDHVRVQLPGIGEPFVLREPALRQQLHAAPAAAGPGARHPARAVGVQLQPSPGLVRAEVELVEPLGAYDIVDISVGEQSLRARTPSQLVRSQGQPVWLSLDAARTHFFDKRSGRSLRAAA
jgi:multiple sugar transport system ATP-binding protein